MATVLTLSGLRKSRRRKELGFVDYCRVDKQGKMHCYNKPISASNRKWRKVPLEKSGQGSRKTVPDNKWGGDIGSNLFTSTSKVHAPSWSLGMGATCPVIRTPVAKLVKKIVKGKEKMSNDQIIARLEKRIPGKCLACYALGDNYPKVQTQSAMARRKTWFDNTPDKEVEDTLVKAISVAGDEECSKATGECTYIPMAQPRRFRLFDSGDFTSPRDVRIWRKVMARLPDTKFWAPTTAWMAPCEPGIREEKEHRDMMKELRKMNSLSNVVVRPSAVSIDSPAPALKGFTIGSAVVEKDLVEKQAGKKLTDVEGKFVELCTTKPDGSKGDCRKHYVCPGNCGTCKACWGSKHPIAYVRHGLKPDKRNILTIFNRTVGTHVPSASFDPKSYKEANSLIQRQFVKWADIGPWGGKPPKLPHLKTHTDAEIAQMQADILWTKTKSPTEAKARMTKKVNQGKLSRKRAQAALKAFKLKVGRRHQ